MVASFPATAVEARSTTLVQFAMPSGANRTVAATSTPREASVSDSVRFSDRPHSSSRSSMTTDSMPLSAIVRPM